MTKFIKLLAESGYVDPLEVNNNYKSVRSLVDKKRDVCFIAKSASSKAEWEEIQKLIKKSDLKSMYVKGNPYEAYVVFAPGSENKATRLKDIAEKYKGFLAHNASEEDQREIGTSFFPFSKKVEEFIEKGKNEDEEDDEFSFLKEIDLKDVDYHTLSEIDFNSKSANKFDWKYEGGSNNRYTFNTGEDGDSGIDYEVIFVNHEDSGVYERVYKPKGKGFEKTNEGKPIKINATVMDITLDFMQKNKEWNDLLISPLDSKRYNLVKAFVDKSVPKNKYVVDSEEGIIKISRNFKYNTALANRKSKKLKPKAA